LDSEAAEENRSAAGETAALDNTNGTVEENHHDHRSESSGCG
jgi:hypothetical protein